MYAIIYIVPMWFTKSYNLVDALTGSFIAKDAPIVLVNNGSDKTILKNASKITALGGIDNSIIQECLNITNNLANPETGGKYSLEQAAEVVKNVLDVDKIYYEYYFVEGEDSIFLLKKDFEYLGKKYYKFGALIDDAEGDVRYCIEQNDISKVYMFNYTSGMIPLNLDNFDKNITIEEAESIALIECCIKNGININNLVVDMSEFREDENLYAVRIDSNNSNATFGWFFVSIDGEILD